MSEYITVALIDDIPEGNILKVSAAGKDILLVNYSGVIYALDSICPHAGGDLSDGYLQDSRIHCPWHGWSFNLTDGKSPLYPNMGIQSYPVRLRNNTVQIQLP